MQVTIGMKKYIALHQ